MSPISTSSCIVPDAKQPCLKPLSQFEYCPLSHERQDIRLINLRPGKLGDEICIKIFHASCLEPDATRKSSFPRLSLKELKETVPEGWILRETIEGRYLFIPKNDLNTTTWTHPGPNVDSEQYRGHRLEDLEDYIPQYEALSYTWGNDASVHRVRVQEGYPRAEASNSYLPIRSNLESAFQHLRYQDRARTLWIDAICINQRNPLETEAQVKRMGEIYQRASQVVIWLGPKRDSSSLAIRTLQHLGLQVEHSVDRWWTSPDATEITWGDPQTSLPYSETTWRAIANLFLRSYFQRVWVVQEARLARRGIVQCGSDNVPWNLFRRAIMTLREKTSKSRYVAWTCEGVRDLCNSRFQNDFFRLMAMSRKRKCTDPRDKLYAVLGLATPRVAQGIIPQYKQGLIKVFKDAAVLNFEISSRLDLLSQCSRAGATQSPSWIPNWSKDAGNSLSAVYFSPAAGMSCASYKVTASGQLQAMGVCSDVVARAEHGFLKRTSFEILQPHGSRKDGLPTDALLNQFLNLVFLGSTRERYPTNCSYVSLDELRNRYMNKRSIPLESWPEARFGKLHNLSFITTSTGLIGLAPRDTSPDDIIAVFLGCHMPIILRRKPSVDGFEIIGPCLVHGLMDAEAFLGPLSKPWRVEFYRDNLGYACPYFRNTETNVLTVEDPRLCPPHPEWERLDRDRTADDPRWFSYHKNKVTGEVMNSDPRMLPEELARRGVNLESFSII